MKTMSQNTWNWHIVSFCYWFRRYPQLMSTSISEDRRTAFEPRELGGIRRVWAVSQAGGPTQYPTSWLHLVTACKRGHVVPSISQLIGGIWPPRTPFSGSIRRPEPPAQIDVLRNRVFRRKYRQNLTVSLGGYPRGYITEPQQSSFPP